MKVDEKLPDDMAERIETELLAWRGANGGIHAIHACALGVSVMIRSHLASLPGAGAGEPVGWRLGEPVNPKNLGGMRWLPYEEGVELLNVNTFLGRWREYDDRGDERPDRDRIAFCCQNDHGDVLALGDTSGDGAPIRPTWRVVDEPNEILVPASPAIASMPGEAGTALRALYEWYDRDGSVGGAATVFEENRAVLAFLSPEGK